MTVIRKNILTLSVLALVLPLAACGKKGLPQHPKDSAYPRDYPYAEQKEEKAEPAAKTNEGSAPARSPAGFPLEYPNRPTY